MEKYNHPIQIGLLVAQTLQEWKFGSPHKIKTYNQLGCLLIAKEIQNEKVVKK